MARQKTRPFVKSKTVALQVLADLIETGDEFPDPCNLLFAGRAA
jgi:hypothetical protein